MQQDKGFVLLTLLVIFLVLALFTIQAMEIARMEYQMAANSCPQITSSNDKIVRQ